MKQLFLACLCAPLMAMAGGPADPSAPVPKTKYESPLPPPPAAPPAATPDQGWKKANEQVAGSAHSMHEHKPAEHKQ